MKNFAFLIVLASFPLYGQGLPGTPPGFLYVNPLNNADGVSTYSSIVLRPDVELPRSELAAGTVIVRGSQTGDHPGVQFISDDNRTIVFEPREHFGAGEKITVRWQANPKFPSTGFEFTTEERHFSPTIPRSPSNESAEPAPQGPARTQAVVMNGVGVPTDFPYIKVAVNGTTAPGGLFFNNWGGTPYMFILRNDGSPQFFRRMPSRARDFKIQPTGTLTYRLADPYNVFYGLDSTFAVTDTFACGNGLGTDEHDLQLLPNGHALMIGLDYHTVDMSKIVSGGDPAATVVGNTLQELDQAKHVVFEWRSWDHYSIADAVHENLKASYIDYVHMNAITIDDDGNYVVSSRHLSEITKIDRTTGAVIWRLGGAHNQFSFPNDPVGFSYQHDIRALGNGHYTMFDNGDFQTPVYTRGLEYVLDANAKTATVVWQYRHVPDWYCWWMGNVQRLPNGNTLICWADQSLPKITEVNPAGTIVYQCDFISPANCYRAFRFNWMGKARTPEIQVESTPDSTVVIANTWGRTDIARYRIYAGTTPSPKTLIDSGKGPILRVNGLPSGVTYYFRVTAVDSAGTVTGYSNEESALVRTTPPGSNMILNSGFDDGSSFWTLGFSDNAVATGSISGGMYVLQYTTPGPNTYSVQLIQPDLPLVNGRKYLFEFDAGASAARTIAAVVEQNGGSYINYSKSGLFSLTTTVKHFSVPFTMTDPTDLSARVTFNCGVSPITVVLDNASLKEVIAAGVDNGTPPAGRPAVELAVYPNPFNPTTTIRISLPERRQTTVTIIDLLGRTVATLINEYTDAGVHSIPFDASRLASGTYFVHVQSGALRLTHQILLLK